MGKTTFEISMSLDGFVTASNQTPEEPLGKDGEQHLHGWGSGTDETTRRMLEGYQKGVGAYLCGRRTYEHSLPWWGADGPSGQLRIPTVVVTHAKPAETPPDSVCQFVTDGIESALKQAHAAAGGKDVIIIGGADLGRQYIAAGLVDEIAFHVVPFLFGSGTRMFEDLHKEHVQLEPVEVLSTPSATHLRYRIVR